MSSSDCMLSTSSDAARIWQVITRTIKSSQALKSLAGSDTMLCNEYEVDKEFRVQLQI